MVFIVLGIILIAVGIAFVLFSEVFLLKWYKKFSDEWENKDDLSKL